MADRKIHRSEQELEAKYGARLLTESEQSFLAGELKFVSDVCSSVFSDHINEAKKRGELAEIPLWRKHKLLKLFGYKMAKNAHPGSD